MRPSAAAGCCTFENGASTTPETLRHLSSYPAAPLSAHVQHQQQPQRHHPKSQQPPLRHAATGAPSWAPPQSSFSVANNQLSANAKCAAAGIAGAHFQPAPTFSAQLAAVPRHRSLHAAAASAFQHHAIAYQTAAAPLLSPEVTPHNYAKLPLNANVNQQRIHECAGIPLISNASSHLTPAQRQRLQRKSSHSPAPHQKGNAPPLVVGEPLLGNGSYNWHTSGTYVAHGNGGGCIAQLAAHTQGMPLLLHKQPQAAGVNGGAPQWCVPGSTYLPAHAHGTHLNVYPTHSAGAKAKANKPLRPALRYQYSAPAALNSRNKEHVPQCAQDLSRTGNAAGSEDCGGGEACLPRIIKPRKRRKKDRKPASGVFLKLDSADLPKGAHVHFESSSRLQLQHHQQQQKQQQQHQLNNHEQLNAEGKLNTALSCQLSTAATPTLPHRSSERFGRHYVGLQQHQDSSVNYDRELPLGPQLERSLPLSRCLYGTKQACPRLPHTSHDAHGICFCAECDPLRFIWDYPLRRSLSDSSAASTCTKSSTSSNASSDTASSCSSAQTSDSDSTAVTPMPRSRADIVGVIGSNRQSHDSSGVATTNTNANANSSLQGMLHQLAAVKTSSTHKSATNGCLSDSNDSGYGDILGGISIADDLFSHNYTGAGLCAQLPPSVDTPAAVTAATPAAADFTGSAASLLLLPTTAETLLTESINEISRKLIETCVNELPEPAEVPSAPGSVSAYSGCGSDLSTDSGIDSAAIVQSDELVFKFDDLNIAGAFDTPTASTTDTFMNLANETDFLLSSNMDLLFDLNNNSSGSHKHSHCSDGLLEFDRREREQQVQQQQHSQQFINNCFDLMWPNTFDRCIGHASTTIMDVIGK